MEVALISQLEAILSGDNAAIKQAEEFLRNAERQPGYVIVLLKIMTEQSVSMNARHQSAVTFKNFVKRSWPNLDDPTLVQISEEERGVLKTNIVQIMLTAPKPIQSQLGEALSIISRHDFPAKWPNLIPEMAAKMTTTDLRTIVGVLETLLTIFERYRHEMKSQSLFMEIKTAVTQFGAPLLQLFQQMFGALQAQQGNVDASRTILEIIHLIAQLFFLLNVQDIPEFFEDTMDKWMDPFLQLLKYTNPALNPSDPEKPSVVELVKASICESVQLYAAKYEEEFKKWLQPFVQTVWDLVTTLPESMRYDQLVVSSIHLFTTVVKQKWNVHMFSSEPAMRSLCERVVIPQIKLRESDVELFNINGLEYVRMDMEGSNAETRRKTAADFIRGLMVHFEGQVTAVLKGYVGVLLEQYQADPDKNWVAKDAAMYIIMALVVKGAVEKIGVTEVNPYVNIVEFLGSQVLPELQTPLAQREVLKADCLRFLLVFRQQVPKEAYGDVLALIVKHLASETFVVHTYAACALDKFLTLPAPWQQVLKPQLPAVLAQLFKVFEQEESKENQFVMKAVLKVCSTGKEDLAPHAAAVIGTVQGILARISQNPRSPDFNHYVFETLACLIQFICKAVPEAVKSFEGALFPVFTTMLGMEASQEFGPYVFQILAQLLDFEKEVPQAFRDIFPSLLHPALYKNQGNIPALSRLFRSYMRKRTDLIPANLQGIMAVCHLLMQARKTEHVALQFIRGLTQHYPMSVYASVLPQVFGMFFERLGAAARFDAERKTETAPSNRWRKHMIGLMSHFVCVHGFKAWAALLDSMQPGLSAQFLERVWIPKSLLATGDDKLLEEVAFTTILTTPESLESAVFAPLWHKLFMSALSLFEREEDSQTSCEDEERSLETGVSGVFAMLAYAPDIVNDSPVASVKQPKIHFAQALRTLFGTHPQMAQSVDGSVQKVVQHVLGWANVSS